MIKSYQVALAEGTRKNRDRQAEHYLKFCLIHGIPYLTPSTLQTCLYAQALANQMSSPGSCKNYMSGVKLWITAHGGDPSPFSSPEVQAVLKGAARLSTHISAQAPGITPQDVMTICNYLGQAGPPGITLKAALLLGYFTFLRQSNILSPSLEAWAGPHTLTRADVLPRPHGLTVVVRSSKTITRMTQAAAILVYAVPRSLYCPVEAWHRACALVPAPPQSPAFLLPGPRPLTAAPLVAVMREALRRAGCPYADKVTAHSLRRGAALLAADAGSPLEDLCHHGTWAGASGLSAYVPPERITSVPGHLAVAFGPESRHGGTPPQRMAVCDHNH